MHKGLNETHPSPAYHAGRFLAVCQHVQDLATSEINATYVDRFFARASTFPAGVLPRVFGVAIHRLKGIDDWMIRSDILATLTQLHQELSSSWPGHLSAIEQGLFQLGFFHQIAALPRKDGRARIRTSRGEAVKSNGEQAIANILFAAEIEYEYERRLWLDDSDGKSRMDPDFTIHRPKDGAALFIEYTGMEGDEAYDRLWGLKAARYRHLEAKPIEECLIENIFPERVLYQIRPQDRFDREMFERELVRRVRSFLAGTVIDQDSITGWAP